MSNAYVEYFRKQEKGLIPVQKIYIIKATNEENLQHSMNARVVNPAAVTSPIDRKENF